jgi:hypothetical protein
LVRLGSDDTEGEAVVADLYLRPWGRWAREHVHGYLHGSFVVLEGRVGFRLDGMAAAGETWRSIPGTWAGPTPAGRLRRLAGWVQSRSSTSRQKASTRAFHSSGISWKG